MRRPHGDRPGLGPRDTVVDTSCRRPHHREGSRRAAWPPPTLVITPPHNPTWESAGLTRPQPTSCHICTHPCRGQVCPSPQDDTRTAPQPRRRAARPPSASSPLPSFCLKRGECFPGQLERPRVTPDRGQGDKQLQPPGSQARAIHHGPSPRKHPRVADEETQTWRPQFLETEPGSPCRWQAPYPTPRRGDLRTHGPRGTTAEHPSPLHIGSQCVWGDSRGPLATPSVSCEKAGAFWTPQRTTRKGCPDPRVPFLATSRPARVYKTDG